MNVAMRMTLDGLVKALKSRAHELAEHMEEEREPPSRRRAGEFDDRTKLRPGAGDGR